MRSIYFLRRPVLWGLALYVLLILAARLLSFFDNAHEALTPFWEQKVALQGIIAAPPDPRPRGTVYVVALETIRALDSGAPPASVSAQIHLQVSGPAPLSPPGERVSFIGMLRRLPAARVPGTFDYGEYLATKGIAGIVYTGARSFRTLGPSGSMRLARWGWRAQTAIITLFREHLSHDQATVLAGLVVGSRPRFNAEIKQIFLDSGTMHVLVASGSNVAFLIGAWYLFARMMFRLPRRGALGTSLPLVWIYVVLVGMEAPITRAAVMASVGLTAHLIHREDRPYQALGLAALVLLLFSPRTLFDVGFQMSFLTVFGMIHTLPRLEPLLPEKSPLTRWALRLCSATFTAQAWIFPITVNVFRRMAPLSFIANIIIIPLSAGGFLAGLSLLAAGAAARLHPIFDTLLRGTAWVVGKYLDLLIGIVKFFADHPHLNWWMTPLAWPALLGIYLLLFGAVWVRDSWAARAFCGIGLFMVGAGLLLPAARVPRGERLTLIDMGRAQTMLLELQSGRYLINPGQPDQIERTLLPFLMQKRIRRVDAVILTKPGSTPEGLALLSNAITIADRPVKRVELGEAFLLEISGRKLLLADYLPLEIQGRLLANKELRWDVMETRFSEKILWSPEFVRRAKPALLVETAYITDTRPSRPPWPAPLYLPQNMGYLEIPLPTPAAENENRNDP